MGLFAKFKKMLGLNDRLINDDDQPDLSGPVPDPQKKWADFFTDTDVTQPPIDHDSIDRMPPSLDKEPVTTFDFDKDSVKATASMGAWDQEYQYMTTRESIDLAIAKMQMAEQEEKKSEKGLLAAEENSGAANHAREDIEPHLQDIEKKKKTHLLVAEKLKKFQEKLSLANSGVENAEIHIENSKEFLKEAYISLKNAKKIIDGMAKDQAGYAELEEKFNGATTQFAKQTNQKSDQSPSSRLAVAKNTVLQLNSFNDGVAKILHEKDAARQAKIDKWSGRIAHGIKISKITTKVGLAGLITYGAFVGIPKAAKNTTQYFVNSARTKVPARPEIDILKKTKIGQKTLAIFQTNAALANILSSRSNYDQISAKVRQDVWSKLPASTTETVKQELGNVYVANSLVEIASQTGLLNLKKEDKRTIADAAIYGHMTELYPDPLQRDQNNALLYGKAKLGLPVYAQGMAQSDVGRSFLADLKKLGIAVVETTKANEDVQWFDKKQDKLMIKPASMSSIAQGLSPEDQAHYYAMMMIEKISFKMAKNNYGLSDGYRGGFTQQENQLADNAIWSIVYAEGGLYMAGSYADPAERTKAFEKFYPKDSDGNGQTDGQELNALTTGIQTMDVSDLQKCAEKILPEVNKGTGLAADYSSPKVDVTGAFAAFAKERAYAINPMAPQAQQLHAADVAKIKQFQQQTR